LDHCRTAKYKGKLLLTHLKEVDVDTPWQGDATQLPFPATEQFSTLTADRQGRRIWNELLIEAKYDGYLQRESAEINRLQKLEDVAIPENIDYEKISGLSNESRMKLLKVRPSTIGQAGRIDGVTPADIALLQVNILRMKESKGE
jgi:tRNA uridine 5-carboxymethylaminomethyl modification enzyme